MIRALCSRLIATGRGAAYALRHLYGELDKTLAGATAAIDDELNEHGYIVPGLGDAGDRLYGTK